MKLTLMALGLAMAAGCAHGSAVRSAATELRGSTRVAESGRMLLAGPETVHASVDGPHPVSLFVVDRVHGDDRDCRAVLLRPVRVEERARRGGREAGAVRRGQRPGPRVCGTPSPARATTCGRCNERRRAHRPSRASPTRRAGSTPGRSASRRCPTGTRRRPSCGGRRCSASRPSSAARPARGARLHDVLTRHGAPARFTRRACSRSTITTCRSKQRRKVLLFRATVLALVDGPCTGLCHDEKCRDHRGPRLPPRHLPLPLRHPARRLGHAPRLLRPGAREALLVSFGSQPPPSLSSAPLRLSRIRASDERHRAGGGGGASRGLRARTKPGPSVRSARSGDGELRLTRGEEAAGPNHLTRRLFCARRTRGYGGAATTLRR